MVVIKRINQLDSTTHTIIGESFVYCERFLKGSTTQGSFRANDFQEQQGILEIESIGEGVIVADNKATLEFQVNDVLTFECKKNETGITHSLQHNKQLFRKPQTKDPIKENHP